MPKRRMTAARILQIATWQKAGANSPRRTPAAVSSALFMGRKVIPTGKKTLLYHRTNPFNADKIVKTRRWISGGTAWNNGHGRSWFTMLGPSTRSGYYGKAVVSVKVPRKMVRIEHPYSSAFATVANKDLKGLPVKRLM